MLPNTCASQADDGAGTLTLKQMFTRANTPFEQQPGILWLVLLVLLCLVLLSNKVRFERLRAHGSEDDVVSSVRPLYCPRTASFSRFEELMPCDSHVAIQHNDLNLGVFRQL